MAAKREPVDYHFNFVLEHPGPLDPKIPFRVVGYSEPARQTRNISLLSRQRPLVFFRDKPSRDKFFRLGWKDRTLAFFEEWSKEEGSESWVHHVTSTKPAPILTPDTLPVSQTQISIEDEDDIHGIVGDVKARVPVKVLIRELTTGKFDGHLKGLLKAEKDSGAARAGAIAAIVTRMKMVSL